MSSTIRLATEYDASQIQAIYEPYVLNTAVSFEMDPPTEEDMRRRITETMVHFPWLVCEHSSGAVQGYVYAHRHGARAAYQWSVDTAVYINPLFHRQGVGRALYSSLFAVLPTLGFYNAFAAITLPNDGSVGLHEAMGFSQCGLHKFAGYKLGEWRDIGWWSKCLRSNDPEPEPPTVFSAVADRPEVLAIVRSGEALLK